MRLLNNPEEHLDAQESDGAYQRLVGITPPNVIVTGEAGCAGAVETLGLPVGEALGWGYYWEGAGPLKAPAPDEERAVLSLAAEAARRVGTPYLAVDIGLTEDGKWVVIETGDAQFSGVSQMPLLPLWSRLEHACDSFDMPG